MCGLFPVLRQGSGRYRKRGGKVPKWRADGKELFYATLDQKLMAVPVTTGATFQAQDARLLFQTHMITGPLYALGMRNYYVPSADGKRFMVNTITDAISSPMTVVLNWIAGMAK